ncbi:hypothetical protein SAMN03097699_2638 [Flavobacteriaceae bacterium MAR_2010_188]|nr:hypothetical protein SAMN03097699_2638 [Flavobacteriaceae bacterium MAR_2010_188]
MYNTDIVSTVAEIPLQWDSIMQNDIFLSRKYLQALEKAVPSNIHLKFVTFTKENSLVGFAVMQHVKIYAQDTFRESKGNLVERFLGKLLSIVLKGEILVAGNLTHTGQHGIYFDEMLIERSSFVNLVLSALETISLQIKNETGKSIKVILLKDFAAEKQFIDSSTLENNSFFRVKVQPNMMQSIPSNWKIFEDYYSALNKKYKKRYRTAKRNFRGIISQELSIDDILKYSKELHRLYRTVSDNAKFNTFLLPENNFYEFKNHLGDNFRVFGYFLEGKLIGFYSLIVNDQNLETYFLGYDKSLQFTKSLYLNMLYDMLEFAIVNNIQNVVYARTAMEIKSSVGAKPFAMELYLKHRSAWINYFIKPIFNLLDPSEKWEERHPFA